MEEAAYQALHHYQALEEPVEQSMTCGLKQIIISRMLKASANRVSDMNMNEKTLVYGYLLSPLPSST